MGDLSPTTKSALLNGTASYEGSPEQASFQAAPLSPDSIQQDTSCIRTLFQTRRPETLLLSKPRGPAEPV